MNDIIPKLDGRNFCQSYPSKAKILEKLKHLRDELTHLKQKRKDGITVYDDIYQEMLLLDLRKIVNTVKSFINFYQPGTIQNTKRLVKMT